MSGCQRERILEPWRSNPKSRLDHAAVLKPNNADGSSSKSLESAAERWFPLPMVDLVRSKSLTSQFSPDSTGFQAAELRTRSAQLTHKSNEIHLAIVHPSIPDIVRQTNHNSNRVSMTCKPRPCHHIVRSHQNKPHNSALPPQAFVAPSTTTTLERTTVYSFLTPWLPLSAITTLNRKTLHFLLTP